MARKQLGANPSGTSDASTKSYVDTLVKASTSNMILDGDFENTAMWANAYGVMSTVQKFSGTQSRLITSTGAGQSVNKLVLTHDASGNPLQISTIDGANYYAEVSVYKPSTNTGTGSIHMELHYIDTSGTDHLVDDEPYAQSSLTTNGWAYIYVQNFLPGSNSAYAYVCFTIGSDVPSGDKFYIDRAYMLDCSDSAYNISSANLKAKGDILVATGPSAPTNQTIGSNGQALVADSTQSTGMKWAGIPADFMLVQVGGARSVGTGDFAVGHRVGRAFTATSITYQFDTADASGSSSVELRRNGTQVASSNLTVTAANQADGTGTDAARTATISQSFAVGDRINLQITAVGTTPGNGLRAWIVGTWN